MKVLRKLTREEYKDVAIRMKELEGYYSRFTHSFIFHEDPTDKLKAT